MVVSNQINPGMILSIGKKLFRVESSVKVTVPKGTPFIKTKLCDLSNNKIVEKNFQLDQEVSEVALNERSLEFLYKEGKEFLFFDTRTLDQLLVPASIVGEKLNFLKEGVEVTAAFYGDSVFSIELPQFLEIMVSATEGEQDLSPLSNATKMAVLETGAKVEVPPFIEPGDIVKVDTKTNEFIQRV
jgi:elongation factor P